MRLLIDSMILVMVLMILIGTVAYRNSSSREDLELQVVRDGLVEFQERLDFQSALWMAKEDSVGMYPPQIMPGWFVDGLPKNVLASGKRPWLDIAPLDDYNDQPPNPLTTGMGEAGFWYNPAMGVVRARVPQQGTDRLTLELYNRVNGTSLLKLSNDYDFDRAPLAYNANPVTAGQHASLNRRTIGLIEALELEADKIAEAESSDAGSQEEVPWWKQSSVTTVADPEASPAEQQSDRKSLLSP